MSEIISWHDQHPHDPEVASLDSIREVLEEWRQRPTGNDIKIAKFSGAALKILDEPGSLLRLSAESMIEFRSDPMGSTFISPNYKPKGMPAERKPLTARYAGNLMLRAMQHELIYTPNMHYPLAVVTEEDWINAINSVLNDPQRYDNFDTNIWWREIQSNVSDRYKGVKLACQYYKELLPETPKMLDIGCSLNLGYKKILLNETFRLAKFPEDEAVENLINNTIKRRVKSSKATGVDAWDIKEQSARRWIRSCSFYPSELLSVKKVLNFDRTALRNVDNLHYLHHDFAETDLPDELTDEQYDVISFVTVLYECSEEQRKRMLENARKLLSDNGIIIIQDLVEITEDPSTKEKTLLQFYDDFSVPGLYKTIAWAPGLGEEPQVLLEWENARCLKAAAGKDLDLSRLQRSGNQ